MNEISLSGRTALVTGASSGIGAEVARELACDVSTLVLVARRRDRLEDLASELTAAHHGLRVIVRDVDLTDLAATGRLLDELEASGVAIDVLVNNAGFGDRGLLDERPWSKIESLLALNVVSATFLIHRVLPKMVARGFGAIMNVGSVAGIVSKPGSAVYGASKSYLNALSDALSAELRGTGVTVTAVLPGPVPTEFGAMAMKDDAAPVRAASAENAGADERREPRLKLPRAMVVSARECARQAVLGMKRGSARVVPGGLVYTMAKIMDNAPRPVLRELLGRSAAKMRRRQ
ncbi:MAG: SDR family oxidoreductase [Polyangiaceae bacterium]|nr:SDR family oxidoreductase [Polyangiaceae bacterium]